MAGNDPETLLNEIGAYLAEDVEYPLRGTLLYARIGDNVVGPSVFKDAGSHIAYRDGMDGPLCDLLMQFWRTQNLPSETSIFIEYVVHGGRFDLSITYSDDLDPDVSWSDLRDESIRRHFGDKPVLYPSFEDVEKGMTYDL